MRGDGIVDARCVHNVEQQTYLRHVEELNHEVRALRRMLKAVLGPQEFTVSDQVLSNADSDLSLACTRIEGGFRVTVRSQRGSPR